MTRLMDDERITEVPPIDEKEKFDAWCDLVNHEFSTLKDEEMEIVKELENCVPKLTKKQKKSFQIYFNAYPELFYQIQQIILN